MGRVMLNEIFKDYGVRCLPYGTEQETIDRLGLRSLADRTTGFCFILKGNEPVIFFDETRPTMEIRYTVAHELGHIMLGHLSFRYKFFDTQYDCAEREADSFALQLLANELVRRYEAAER